MWDMRLLLLALALVLTSGVAQAAPHRPPASAVERRIVAPGLIHVWDGDTFYVGAGAIRLRGIDAPELGQPRSYEAKRRLSALLHAGPVTIVRHAEDRYGRIVADVYVRGRNVADVLRAEGFAKPRSPAPGLRYSSTMRAKTRHTATQRARDRRSP